MFARMRTAKIKKSIELLFIEFIAVALSLFGGSSLRFSSGSFFDDLYGVISCCLLKRYVYEQFVDGLAAGTEE